MFGKNPHRKQEVSSGNTLHIQKIFYTLQGEGPFAGMAAMFIRLAGCNLACHFCDTEFEEGMKYNPWSIESILGTIRELFGNGRRRGRIYPEFVVLTGGEPMRQNIVPLILALFEAGVELIQIETAGTLWFEDGEAMLNPKIERYLRIGMLHIVCSPKTPKINPDIEHYCHDWKYIIRQGEINPHDGLPNMSTQILNHISGIYRPEREDDTIWLQPCEEYFPMTKVADPNNTRVNVRLATELCLQFNYRLCLQQHKIVGLE